MPSTTATFPALTRPAGGDAFSPCLTHPQQGRTEFLTDASSDVRLLRGSAVGGGAGPLFLLNGEAQGLIEPKRLSRTRLGHAVQLTTVLLIGRFLAEPTDVPTEVFDYLAEQRDIADPSCVKDYRVREMTRLESQSSPASPQTHRPSPAGVPGPATTLPRVSTFGGLAPHSITGVRLTGRRVGAAAT